MRGVQTGRAPLPQLGRAIPCVDSGTKLGSRTGPVPSSVQHNQTRLFPLFPWDVQRGTAPFLTLESPSVCQQPYTLSPEDLTGAFNSPEHSDMTVPIFLRGCAEGLCPSAGSLRLSLRKLTIPYFFLIG